MPAVRTRSTRSRRRGRSKIASPVSVRKPFDSYFRFLCHKEQRELWARAAALADEDDSGFARRELDDAARRIIAEHEAKKRRKS